MEMRKSPAFATLRARMQSLALASVAVIALVSSFVWWSLAPDHYRTGLGEQRSVLLEDGSIVTLNTSSEIEVDYSDLERTVRLLRGEALFEVAHDPSRRFDVDAGAAIVRAIGTQFNIDRRSERTTVSVVEGKVQVIAEPTGSASAPVPEPAVEVITAAHRIIVSEAGMSPPEKLDNLAPVLAWTQRQLVFDNHALSDVAAEFNRYNRRRILIQSPELRSQQITGVFQANDSEPFLAFIARIPGVRIENTTEGHYLVSIDADAQKYWADQGPKL